MFDQINLSQQIKKPMMIGLIVLVVLLGGATLWAALAPIESAAVANGTIIVDTYPKDVQHLEGGIVDKVYVHDGSEVKKGQPLVVLDQTQASSRAELLANRYYALLSLKSRLVAERDKREALVFPKTLIDQAALDQQILQSIQIQRQEFHSRKNRLGGVLKILKQRIAQLAEEIQSMQSQVLSSDMQLKLINKEIVAVDQMVKKQYLPVTRLYALQREAARLEGNRDERRALISRANQRIGETQMMMLQQQSENHTEVLAELRNAQDDLAEIEEQMRSAKDILARTLIIAPRSGKVVNLNVHTKGGVIKSGETLMTIVPKRDELVVEAHVSPMDIDVVKPGMEVKVQLSAYKMRTTPTLKGKVVKVSADVLQDPSTHEVYYLARVLIDAKDLSQQAALQLYPGMPVQVMIIVNRTSMLNYLLSPVTASLSHAFKEQ